MTARDELIKLLAGGATCGGHYNCGPLPEDLKEAADRLDEFAAELAAQPSDKADPYGLSVEWPNARAYLLQLMASWGLKTRDGSREIADKILQLHAHELAERLRNVHITGEGEQWNWWDAATIPESCAALIDPEAQQ